MKDPDEKIARALLTKVSGSIPFRRDPGKGTYSLDMWIEKGPNQHKNYEKSKGDDEHEERRQEVTQATTLALSRGGCLRSGSRASRARHLDQGWINQYSFHISYCPDLSIWRFVRCWPDSGKLGVTSQCTSTRITLAVWFSSLNIGISIY